MATASELSEEGRGRLRGVDSRGHVALSVADARGRDGRVTRDEKHGAAHTPGQASTPSAESSQSCSVAPRKSPVMPPARRA
jgi:hypothetical protein